MKSGLGNSFVDTEVVLKGSSKEPGKNPDIFIVVSNQGHYMSNIMWVTSGHWLLN